MATGSGKTFIMAANILYFYKKGYRNFIFFTRLGNIIQKTKANFLDPNSRKYLFAEKIVIDGKEVKIKEVDNFEGVNEEDINIIFSTTALLHSRFNFARENVLTYEDFEDKKIVLIADEAHNLSAVIISQYRRKIAEKYKIALKPVVMFKANRVSAPKEGISNEQNPQIVVSSIFKESFHKFISELNEKHLKQQTIIKDATLQKAFQFFGDEKITLVDLAAEIKSDFAAEKCLTVDEDKDLEKKQILLNSLEDPNNEIRAIFATDKLNEGWDVLNLFDIVRLYNSRDAKGNKPGKTTVQEAQLIGRGARYYPFTTGEFNDAYRRKFDDDAKNELRILEQLYYHSMHNPDYISELTKVLVREGIMPERTIKREIKIKESFKNSDFWKKGYIFLNSRKENFGKDVFALADVKAEFDHNAEINIFQLPTREAIEKDLFVACNDDGAKGKVEIREYKLSDLGIHIIRAALSKIPDGQFEELKKIFGNIESIKDFIFNYLDKVKVKVRGASDQIDNLL
ncbi:MAG: DEAD/DEAH box helicase family protein [bacterium]